MVNLTKAQEQDIRSRMKPKAYSYIRFSSPAQEQGDSFRRQTEMAKEYCQKKGLELEKSAQFYDRGISGYRGKHKKAALKDFLDLVEAGEVKEGSFLLVEDIDRLSRETANNAQRLILQLFDAGINLVTLADGKVYKPNSNEAGDHYMLIGKILQAHDESKNKSKRLKRAWEGKRKDLDKKLTASAPHWLKLSADKKEFHVIEERAKIVQDIFRMTIEGMGAARVARTLSESGVEVWSKGKNRKPNYWHPSYVQKILNGRAVLGEFQPHKIEYTEVKENGERVLKRARIPEGPPIPDYFPQIISDEVHQKATEQIKKNAGFKGGRVSETVNNLFPKLAVCGYCGSSMYFINKGDYKYLGCSKAKNGNGCAKTYWKYEEFEEAFLRFIEGLDFSSVLKKDRAKIEAIESLRLKKSKELEETSKKVQRLIAFLEEGEAPPEVRERLKGLRQLKEKLSNEIAALLSKIEAEEAVTNNVEEDQATILELIKSKQDREARQRLIQELRRKIDRILVCGGGFLDYERNKSGYVDIEAAWKGEGLKNGKQFALKEYAQKVKALKVAPEERFFSVKFKNEVTRIVFPTSKMKDGEPFIYEENFTTTF